MWTPANLRTVRRSACLRQATPTRSIAQQPDCVVYAASGPDRDAASVPDYVRLLEAGINVVTTSSTRLIFPPVFDPVAGDQLRRATQAGRASIYASGIEPGFALDQLALVLTTQSSTIKSIKSTEIGLYDDYAVADVMMDGMGFGRPMDFEPFICMPGVVTHEWSGGLYMIADALGVEIQEVRESVERIPTSRTLQVACGTIEAGTSGAIRTRAIGVVEGNEALEIAHVTRMALDVAAGVAEYRTRSRLPDRHRGRAQHSLRNVMHP